VPPPDRPRRGDRRAGLRGDRSCPWSSVRAGRLPGDRAFWRRVSLEAVPDIRGDSRCWLHGRGSSDSKAGAAIFAHILARLKSAAGRWTGSVVLQLDVDEHTGAFGGARAFFEERGASQVDGVMIGYPGPDHVVTGGRARRAARAPSCARCRGAFRLRQQRDAVGDREGRRAGDPAARGRAAGFGGAGFPVAGQADLRCPSARSGPGPGGLWELPGARALRVSGR
jgi:hypothetical protein